MKLPKEIHYDCATYKKSVRTVKLSDGRIVYIVRYDSDFGTCLCYNSNFALNVAEYELFKMLQKAKVL